MGVALILKPLKVLNMSLCDINLTPLTRAPRDGQGPSIGYWPRYMYTYLSDQIVFVDKLHA